MMTFVNMDSDGLVILPTHRVVHSLEELDCAAFAERREEFFTVERLPGGCHHLHGNIGWQPGTAFVAITGNEAIPAPLQTR